MFFVLLVFSIPFFIFSIWTLFEPEESYLFMRRWRYERTPEISDLHKKTIRVGTVLGMIFWSFLLLQTGYDTFFRPDPFEDFINNQDIDSLP
ncbi:hypothetical protein [Salisediminibacterium selenitireducens]|uniref:DUF6199 domain-containing protein n=1 Tax=Bacillus selenitireducens (strain ATCC 700615 / DSM 15326 / MLS10) TaxID=439292 RepID=D6XSL5_BACIE|nr:hypothetical protein [Salisediminibacterium selenitireducens]ADH98801.1 hypothetical protein Bsel_1289 [[Bacillus] selenitireducens MLS10]